MVDAEAVDEPFSDEPENKGMGRLENRRILDAEGGEIADGEEATEVQGVASRLNSPAPGLAAISRARTSWRAKAPPRASAPPARQPGARGGPGRIAEQRMTACAFVSRRQSALPTAGPRPWRGQLSSRCMPRAPGPAKPRFELQAQVRGRRRGLGGEADTDEVLPSSSYPVDIEPVANDFPDPIPAHQPERIPIAKRPYRSARCSSRRPRPPPGRWRQSPGPGVAAELGAEGARMGHVVAVRGPRPRREDQGEIDMVHAEACQVGREAGRAGEVEARVRTRAIGRARDRTQMFRHGRLPAPAPPDAVVNTTTHNPSCRPPALLPRPAPSSPPARLPRSREPRRREAAAPRRRWGPWRRGRSGRAI